MSGCLSKYDGYTRYMSADTAARREELGQEIATSLTEIEEYSEILRGLKRLSDEIRLDQVWSGSKEFEWWNFLNKMKCWGYLQQELNVTFNMRDYDVRDRELGDVVFYYLMRDEEPVGEIQQMIWRMYWGLLTIEELSWYEICARILVFSPFYKRVENKKQHVEYLIYKHPQLLFNYWSSFIFTQFYKRLENKQQHLEYLIYKHPPLLFNGYSTLLIDELNKHLPHDNLHQILLNTRDENGQTCMFYDRGYLLYDVYRNKFDDLCELLSVRNESGKTALHVNSFRAYDVLLERVTLNNQDKMNELLSIRDNNNKTVYDTADDRYKKQLTWLKHQYEHKNYPLYNRPRVLILYNTDDRPGAEEEAESIQRAFKSVTHRINLEKMGTKREVLQLIEQQAAKWYTSVLIVCVMSHGNIGTIDDSEKNPITLTSIEGAMCSDELKERPKILITQSCQIRAEESKQTDEGATSSNTDPGPPRDAFVLNIPYEPVADHFLSVQSCVSGQTSTRNLFIPYLAEQIENSSKNDRFQDLVELASFKMATEKNEQTPIMKSTLKGKFCLKDKCPDD